MLFMSTASQEGPGLAKVYPGLRFFGITISLTDRLAGLRARLIQLKSCPSRCIADHRLEASLEPCVRLP
jgi:hypothetical protein